MGSISGIVFIKTVGPQIGGPFPQVKLIDRPGTDGRVVRFMPAKSREVVWNTVEWVLAGADAALAQERYNAKRLGFVRATDDLGRWMDFVVVLDVQVIKVQKLAVAVPAANYAVYARWTLIRPA